MTLPGRPWLRPMVARDHDEGHRQASWLELFFDLAFVVAVAQAAKQLEHALAEGHPASGVGSYLMVFAAVWWAWMAFTWFANVFDTDDVPYRLWMMVMIAGALGLAAGVPRLADFDFRIAVVSYVVMRLAYVAQWVRVLRSGEPSWRRVAGRIIFGTTFCQLGWVAFLWMPAEWKMPAFVVWFAVDISTPLLSGWDARMGGHLGHIVERYGLFTIIVLGESIAAATVAVGRALEADVAFGALLTLAAAGLLCVFSLWWIYFDFCTSGRAPSGSRWPQYFWAYAHYFVFASLAALGAGVALAAEWLADPHHVHLSDRGVALVPAVAVAAFLATIVCIEHFAERGLRARHAALKAGAALVVVAAAWAAPALTVPGSVLAVGLVLVFLVATGVVRQHRIHSTG